jgi:hypothetical protein
MQDDRFAHPIWQLDPCYGDEPSYDDYERLFLAAYRATFHLHASPARVRPYVTRARAAAIRSPRSWPGPRSTR